jgi:hypothetical protein
LFSALKLGDARRRRLPKKLVPSVDIRRPVLVIDSHAHGDEVPARWANLADAAKTLILAGNAERIFKLDSNAPRS